MTADILTIIARTLAQNPLYRAGPDIQPEHHLIADLGADGLDLWCVCCAVEEAFGFEIGDDELEGWKRAADVIQSVEGRRVAAASAAAMASP